MEEDNINSSCMPDNSEGITKRSFGIDHFVLRCLTFVFLTSYIFAFSGIITNRAVVIIMGIFGYAALPLLALLSVQAYIHNRKLSTLIIRNLIFAILCALPYRFAFYSQKSFSDIRSYFSLALTCFFCIGSVMFYDRMKTKYQKMFCAAFLCAVSMLIGMEFAPYMPIISFVFFIYMKEQDSRDADGIANNNKERIAAIGRRKYLFSNYTFIKVSFYIVTLSIVMFFVSLLFARYVNGYSDSYGDELTRNYCMPGMLLSLPLIRIYNGRKGISNRFTKIVFRVYYLLLLALVVMIKIFFLYDYSMLPGSG